MNNINQKFKLSLRGWYEWHKLCKTVLTQDSVLMIIPPEDNSLFRHALKYLENYQEQNGNKNIVIMTNEGTLVKLVKKFYPCNPNITVLKVNAEIIYAILQYYNTINFDQRVVILSLNQPPGRIFYKINGIKGITEEVLIKRGILVIKDEDKVKVKGW